MVFKAPTVKLSTGAEMPLVGLGTWQAKEDVVRRAVHCAIDNGYRFIDTAEAYNNEKEIGDALQECFKAGKVKREDMFISTKVFCTHFQPKEMEAAIKRSLSKLQLEYVDLYLAHAPCPLKADGTPDDSVTIEEVWKNLEDLYRRGLTKAIGVSNFTIEQLKRVMKIATVPIHNHQVECSLYLPQHELSDFCAKHSIAFTGYSSIGSPSRFNTTEGADPVKGWPEAFDLREDPLVNELAKKYHKSAVQILLRLLVQRGIIVIPQSIIEDQIKENIDIFDFRLTAEEMKQLNNPIHHQRIALWPNLIGHPEDPFKSERK